MVGLITAGFAGTIQRRIALASGVVVFVAGSAMAQTPAGGWQLLVPGTYHGDEAPARPGPGWLALVAVGGVWRLEPTTVRATRVQDVVLDDDGQKTGIAIASAHAGALVLIRAPGVRAGKADTPDMRFTGITRAIARDRPLEFAFRGAAYRIDVLQSGVFLNKGAQRTRLDGITVSRDAAGEGDSEESATLLWAGDLDGDGELDLLVGYSGYNRGGRCLFLSSLAASGERVGKLACHGGVGC